MRAALVMAWLVAAAQSEAAVALISHARQGNAILLRLTSGRAEIEFLTPEVFRYRRVPVGDLPRAARADREPVDIQITDTPDALAMRTKEIQAAIRKDGALLRVTRANGRLLVEDLGEPQMRDGVVAWDRSAAAPVQFYGLGPRADARLDARGARLAAEVPFLVSTAGYGEYHAGPGALTFDLTGEDRYGTEVRGSVIDYYLAFGTTLKDIFEGFHTAGVAVAAPPLAASGPPAWEGLRDALFRLVQASLSGILTARLDTSAFAQAPAGVRDRAQQLAGVVNAGARRDLFPFFFAYAQEVRDRGFPILHSLPFQFAGDPEAARHADEFMVGDELLAAPIYGPGTRRSVYLPRGIWTRLETGEVFPGRQVIHVETSGLPLFARNGSIVPLQHAVMELHYFPNLGGEFFLYEDSDGNYSQVHAAPAGDITRLEIESFKDRAYEWVIHHSERPAEVGFEGHGYAEADPGSPLAEGRWRFDAARRDLHVRVRAPAGGDCIINISY